MQEMPLERNSVCKISLEPWALLWAPSVLTNTPCFPSKRGWNLCNAMNRFYSLLWTSVNVGVPTISKSFEGRRNIRSFLYLYKQVQYLITKNSLKKINGPLFKKNSALQSISHNMEFLAPPNSASTWESLKSWHELQQFDSWETKSTH